VAKRLAAVTVVVRDYDEAISWFRDALGFGLVEDSPLDGDKRWVRLRADGGGAELLLARAASGEQSQAVGRAAGGRVAYFLETDDFEATLAQMRRMSVEFLEAPRAEAYGRVVKFVDLYGNRWDLIQPATPDGDG
jgi:catechol 2,3-dioxygenase-like lactoylglutathione lyase family enzyme